jgi:hypothetical protein
MSFTRGHTEGSLKGLKWQRGSPGQVPAIAEFPQPAPITVRHGFAILAVCGVLGTFPAIALLAVLNIGLHEVTARLLGIGVHVPFEIIPFLGGWLAFAWPVVPIYGRTSRFIVESVAEWIIRGDLRRARALAISRQHLVWFRHWKKCEPFVDLVSESPDVFANSKYEKFAKRLAANRPLNVPGVRQEKPWEGGRDDVSPR